VGERRSDPTPFFSRLENLGQRQTDFDLFYKQQMEKSINQIKERLVSSKTAQLGRICVLRVLGFALGLPTLCPIFLHAFADGFALGCRHPGPTLLAAATIRGRLFVLGAGWATSASSTDGSGHLGAASSQLRKVFGGGVSDLCELLRDSLSLAQPLVGLPFSRPQDSAQFFRKA
jgi:hypothetical protein